MKPPLDSFKEESVKKVESKQPGNPGRLELESAANFLAHLINLGRRNIPNSKLEKFRLALVEVLRRRYRDH